MKVYFSANHRDIQKDIEVYREILKVVQSTDLVLINNWIESVGDRIPPYESALRWMDICYEARAGVDDADIVLAEASGASSFGSGLEVGYALGKNKKVIILIRADKLNDSYASGLDRSEVEVVEYTSSVLASPLKEVLKRAAK